MGEQLDEPDDLSVFIGNLGLRGGGVLLVELDGDHVVVDVSDSSDGADVVEAVGGFGDCVGAEVHWFQLTTRQIRGWLWHCRFILFFSSFYSRRSVSRFSSSTFDTLFLKVQ